MKILEIYKVLDQISPFELQEPWDNSGLIVGSMEDSFGKIYIGMDIDEEFIEEVENNSLIITHHPLIFKGLKTINYDTYSSKILKKIIKKDISLISMHTNFDKTHLNKYLVTKVLNFKIKEEKEFIIYCDVNMEFEKLTKYVSEKLNTNILKVVRSKDIIETLAITSGSGMSLLNSIEADCFLTGDIKYHEAMEAKARNIGLIDIRHYESERYFNTLLVGLIEPYLNLNKLKAIIKNSKNPFEFIVRGETIE